MADGGVDCGDLIPKWNRCQLWFTTLDWRLSVQRVRKGRDVLSGIDLPNYYFGLCRWGGVD